MQVELNREAQELLFKLRCLYQKKEPTYNSSPTHICNTILIENFKVLLKEEKTK